MAQFVPPDDLVSIDDAAAEFGLSRRTLYRLITDLEIRKYKQLGDRKSYISRSTLQANMGFRERPAKYG